MRNRLVTSGPFPSTVKIPSSGKKKKNCPMSALLLKRRKIPFHILVLVLLLSELLKRDRKKGKHSSHRRID